MEGYSAYSTATFFAPSSCTASWAKAVKAPGLPPENWNDTGLVISSTLTGMPPTQGMPFSSKTLRAGPLDNPIPPRTATTSASTSWRAQAWDSSGDMGLETRQGTISMGRPSTPPSSVLMNSMAPSVEECSSGMAPTGPESTFMNPTLMGSLVPSAAVGSGTVPSNHSAPWYLDSTVLPSPAMVVTDPPTTVPDDASVVEPPPASVESDSLHPATNSPPSRATPSRRVIPIPTAFPLVAAPIPIPRAPWSAIMALNDV